MRPNVTEKYLRVVLFFLMILWPFSHAIGGIASEMKEAEHIYVNNSDKFREISQLILSYETIVDIVPEKRVEDGEEFLLNGIFTDETAYVFNEVAQRIGELGLNRVQVQRFPLTGSRDRIVYFVVKTWGDLPGLSSISIVRYIGNDRVDRLNDPSSVCNEIDPPEWFVCYTN